MVMISLSTSPGCGPRFLAGWASSLSSRASQCGRTAWKKSSNWQKSSTSRSNIDASPHLMAPTQKEEFKGDKGLASPQTRNSGFVNWFSFFLTLSLLAAVIFVVAPDYRPVLGKFAHRYAVQLVFLLMHIPAFVGILTFRHYILAADRKIEAITRQLGHSGDSPIPA